MVTTHPRTTAVLRTRQNLGLMQTRQETEQRVSGRTLRWRTNWSESWPSASSLVKLQATIS